MTLVGINAASNFFNLLHLTSVPRVKYFILKFVQNTTGTAANECLQLEGKDDDELVKLRFH
jgi:hypothetical protein